MNKTSSRPFISRDFVVGANEDKKPMNAILGAKGLSALTTLKSAGDFLQN